MGSDMSKLISAINHPEKEKDIKKAFDGYDKDKSGTLTGDELKELGKDLQKLLGHAKDKEGADHWKDEAREMQPDRLVQQYMDKNGDKAVSYEEFKKFILSLQHK